MYVHEIEDKKLKAESRKKEAPPVPGCRSHSSRMVVTAVGAQRLAAATGDATWPVTKRRCTQELAQLYMWCQSRTVDNGDVLHL